MAKSKKIVMTGGGTAGHVTPNIALMPALQEAGYEITYIGSYNGMEKELIEAQKIPYIGISSGLSGTFNSVRLIANEFDGLNIHCFDSKALSCAQNMLISTAVTALKTTDNVQEILNKLQKTRKKMVAMFCVRDLTYLIKGGRIGKVAGTVGTLLKLCPVIKVNDDGVYETASKTIGFNRAIDTLINEFKTHFANAEIAISLTYSSNKEIAEKIKSEIKKHCKVKSCEMNPVTAVLGVHTGPDMAGIAAYQI